MKRNPVLTQVIEGVQYTPQSKDCVAAILNGLEDKIEGGLDPALEFVTILRTQAFDKLTRTWESSTAPPMTEEDWVAYSTYCSTYDRLAERKVILAPMFVTNHFILFAFFPDTMQVVYFNSMLKGSLVGTVEQQSDGINCAHYVLAMVYAFVNQLDMGYANEVDLSRVNITKQRQDVTECIKAAMAVIGPEAAMFPTAPVASPPQYKDVLRASSNRPAPGQYLSLHPWPISSACPCPYPCPHRPPSDTSPYPGTSTSSCPGGMPISACCSQQAANNTSPRPEPSASSRP
ncbi:hypothetical protein V8C86DRAFT_3093396 [Haematococcus lacustris]